MCDPINKIYERIILSLIKETAISATEQTQCAGLNFFKAIVNIVKGEDRNLITTCTVVSY